MNIQTKYNIGEEVYYVSSDGGLCNHYSVKIGTIKQIKIGGKYWEKYTIDGLNTRGERNLFKTLKEAKKNACEEAEKHFNTNIDLIKESNFRELKENI